MLRWLWSVTRAQGLISHAEILERDAPGDGHTFSSSPATNGAPRRDSLEGGTSADSLALSPGPMPGCKYTMFLHHKPYHLISQEIFPLLMRAWVPPAGHISQQALRHRLPRTDHGPLLMRVIQGLKLLGLWLMRIKGGAPEQAGARTACRQGSGAPRAWARTSWRRRPGAGEAMRRA